MTQTRRFALFRQLVDWAWGWPLCSIKNVLLRRLQNEEPRILQGLMQEKGEELHKSEASGEVEV
jgi:hypothetical protein